MGAPGTFTVELDELDELVLDMERCQRALEAIADDVDREVVALQEVWQGLAAEAHREAQAEWAAGMAAMRAALGDLRAVARTAHDNYTAAAVANEAMWGQLR